MGLFTKSEVIILKDSSDAKEYLVKLEELVSQAKGKVKEQILKDIAITKAGIAGEENLLFELKNSGLDLVILHDIYIKSGDLVNREGKYGMFTGCSNYPKCKYTQKGTI